LRISWLTVGILALPGSLLHRWNIQTTRQKHQAPHRCRGRFETAEDHGGPRSCDSRIRVCGSSAFRLRRSAAWRRGNMKAYSLSKVRGNYLPGHPGSIPIRSEICRFPMTTAGVWGVRVRRHRCGLSSRTSPASAGIASDPECRSLTCRTGRERRSRGNTGFWPLLQPGSIATSTRSWRCRGLRCTDVERIRRSGGLRESRFAGLGRTYRAVRDRVSARPTSGGLGTDRRHGGESPATMPLTTGPSMSP
jgi:hypothetical protein